MGDEQERADEKRREGGGGWKRWLVGALVLLLAVFVAQNSQSVEVDFIFASTETPLIFALVLAVALGGAVGWLVSRLGSRGEN